MVKVWLAARSVPSVNLVRVLRTADVDGLDAADDRRRGWSATALAVRLAADPDRVGQSQPVVVVVVAIIISCSCWCGRSVRAKMTAERADVRELVTTSRLLAVCRTLSLMGAGTVVSWVISVSNPQKFASIEPIRAVHL